MLHSNLHHMTTLFPISINDYNKTGYLVYCFYNLHILLHLSGYVSLVDHHVDVRVGWGALWLPSIFPPWQIPTMVGFCPWWLWWESVRWQIPTISDDEEIFLVQFRPKCWSQHGATSTRTTNRQLFMLLRLCPRNARNLHGLSNFYIHSILVIIIIMLELNRSN